MKSTLRCQCGTVRGQVDLDKAYGRATCYCKYCQAFARALGQDRTVLNRRGGTEILAMLPAAIRFSAGHDHLVCTTFSEKGPLRWYASCCHTPIANTPKNHQVAYVGLLKACLNSSSTVLDQSLGPVKIALNTQSARGKVDSTPLATFIGMARIFKNVLKAKWGGQDKANPFFLRGSGRPLQTPRPIKRFEPEGLRRSA
jgi:hypothetical protein